MSEQDWSKQSKMQDRLEHERQSKMQPKRSQTPFDLDTLYAVAAIIFLILILLSTSCISIRDDGDEPEWKPHVYLYSPNHNGRCVFVDGGNHTVDCDEPMIHDFALLPLENLKVLKTKLQRCEVWR